MAGATTQRIPRCPRCRYDQTGVVASWVQSCPLETTCAECGYAFPPAAALDPGRERVRWLYEHSRWWDLVAIFKTLAVILVPPVFWRRIRPGIAVRPRRLIAWALILAALSVFGFAGVHWAGHESYHHYQQRLNLIAMPRLNAPPPKPILEIETYPRFLRVMIGNQINHWRPIPRRNFPMSIAAVAAFSLVATVVAISVPSQWKGERVAPRHFLRIGVYSLAPVFLIHWAFACALSFRWIQLSVLTAWELHNSATPTTVRLPQIPWMTELASGGYLRTTLTLAIAWQLLYLAIAFRSGLQLTRWFRLWALAAGCGLVAAFIAAIVPLVQQWA